MNSLDAFARKLRALERQVRANNRPRLANSTIEDGALRERDVDGNLRGQFGRQHDETHAPLSMGGPPPPVPSTPTWESVPGGIRFAWDGYFAGGAVVPMDFARVEFHATQDPVDTDPDVPWGDSSITLIGTVETPRGGYCTIPADVDPPTYARLVSRSLSGQRSVPGEVSTPAVGGLVGPTHLSADAIDGKVITGATFQTSEDDPKGLFDVAGLRFVNADGDVLFEVDAATAAALITGEYRSANSGKRFVINEGGVNPGQIRFYGIAAGYGKVEVIDPDGYPALSVTGPVSPSGRVSNVDLNLGRAVLRQFKPATPYGDRGEFNASENQLWVEHVFNGGTGKFIITNSSGYPYMEIYSQGQIKIHAPTLIIGELANDLEISGNVTFNIPGASTLGAAATTAAQTQTLANALRARMNELGLG